MNLNRVIQTIKNNDRFLISTHINPDPDALCSQLAVAFYLKTLKKRFWMVNEEKVPKRFEFISGAERIKSYKKGLRINYDVIIVVDCGELDRIGKVKQLIVPNKTLINIDHHLTNDRFGELNLVMPRASSTAEVLFYLLKKSGCPLTRTLAMYLYIGIMTDTGSFRFENTMGKTHQIVSELMRFKFSPNELYKKIYETIPLNDFRAFTEVVSQFEILYDGKVICVPLTKKTLSRFSDEFDLKDAIFKFLRAIKGVEVLAIFTEVRHNQTRTNLRAISKVNVAHIASYFKGGGHRRASGYKVEKSFKEAQKDFLVQIKKVL